MKKFKVVNASKTIKYLLSNSNKIVYCEVFGVAKCKNNIKIYANAKNGILKILKLIFNVTILQMICVIYLLSGDYVLSSSCPFF